MGGQVHHPHSAISSAQSPPLDGDSALDIRASARKSTGDEQRRVKSHCGGTYRRRAPPDAGRGGQIPIHRAPAPDMSSAGAHPGAASGDRAQAGYREPQPTPPHRVPSPARVHCVVRSSHPQRLASSLESSTGELCRNFTAPRPTTRAPDHAPVAPPLLRTSIGEAGAGQGARLVVSVTHGLAPERGRATAARRGDHTWQDARRPQMLRPRIPHHGRQGPSGARVDIGTGGLVAGPPFALRDAGAGADRWFSRGSARLSRRAGATLLRGKN